MLAEINETLDRFLDTLEQKAKSSAGGATVGPGLTATSMRGDAIDQVLAAPPRETRAVNLRDSEVMTQFRREVTDGLIRVDTLNRVLTLAIQVLQIAGARAS